MQLRGGEAVECRDSWQGPFRFPDGATYYGEVTDGRICGQGEWRSAKGDCYFGSFRDDVFHGRGMYMEASGSTVEGTFELGRLCGPGTYCHADGRADLSNYIDGTEVGEGVRWSPDRQQAWRLHDGKLDGSGELFDVEKDQISLYEAEAIASRLGLSAPPSVYEMSVDGKAAKAGGETSSHTNAELKDGEEADKCPATFELSEMDARLAGTSLAGRDGFLVAHSARPVVPPEICDAVVAECEARASRLGGWTTKRHSSYATTDVPLQRLPEALEWFRSRLLPEVAWPFLACAFGPLLPVVDGEEPSEQIFCVADAFVVKYNASSGQRQLEPHRDGSVFSFNVALNGLEEYEGGGTSFQVLDGSAIRSPKGHMMAHSSALMHGGHPIQSGVRYILVVFVTVKAKHAKWAAQFREYVESISHL